MSFPDAELLLFEGLGGMLLALMAKSTLVLGFAWVAARLAYRSSASVRHVIWIAALGYCLIIPLWAHLGPAISLDVIQPVPEGPVEQVESLSTDAVGTGAPGVIGAIDDGAAPSLRMSERVVQHIGIILFAVWLVGVSFHVSRIIYQLFATRRLRREATLVTDLSLLQEAGIARKDARLAKSPTIVFHPQAMPMTGGYFRPVIYLPEESIAWPGKRLHVVLLHEMAHIKRGDYLSHLISEFTRALLWPNPLVWMAWYHLHDEQEQACDDLVIRSGTLTHEYAAHLLAVARNVYAPVPGAATTSRTGAFKRRIKAILDYTRPRNPVTRLASLALIVLLGGFSLPVSSVHFGFIPTTEVEAEAVQDALMAAAAAILPEAAREVLPEVAHETPVELRIQGEAGHKVGGISVLATPLGLRYIGSLRSAPPMDGYAEYHFRITERDTFALWGKTFGRDRQSNSFLYSVDGGEERIWDFPSEPERPFGTWAWTEFRPRNAPSAERFILEAGTHRLRIRVRERGAGLDQIVVTNSPNWRPTTPKQQKGPVYLWLEAENAELSRPLQVRTAPDASRAAFLVAGGGRDSRDVVPERGRALLPFETPAENTYYLWGRVASSAESGDSFWLKMNDRRWYPWELRNNGSEWTWRSVRDRNGIHPFALKAGPQYLEIAWREDGARVDRFLVTTDSTFRPQGPGTSPPHHTR